MHASLTEIGFEITSIVPERAQEYTGAPRLPFNLQSAWASAERVKHSSCFAGTCSMTTADDGRCELCTRRGSTTRSYAVT